MKLGSARLFDSDIAHTHLLTLLTAGTCAPLSVRSHPDEGGGEDDVVKQHERVFTAVFCTHTQLIRNSPAWRHRVTKLTKAGIKNLKPFLIRDQQD